MFYSVVECAIENNLEFRTMSGGKRCRIGKDQYQGVVKSIIFNIFFNEIIISNIFLRKIANQETMRRLFSY